MPPIFSDVLDFLLPRLCCACDCKLHVWENQICALCLMEIPLSNHHLDPDNLLAQTFWGRVEIEQAGAWFLFHKDSRFQRILYRLKYEHRPMIGVGLGRIFGTQLLQSGVYTLPDLIVPVPLHRKRQQKRGYNQSAKIARGLSISTGIPLCSDLLLRTKKTKTQTSKTREARYENVKGKFTTPKPNELEGKHILLVDDVITTGATIEACAEMLLAVEGVQVSVVSLAFASKW